MEFRVFIPLDQMKALDCSRATSKLELSRPEREKPDDLQGNPTTTPASGHRSTTQDHQSLPLVVAITPVASDRPCTRRGRRIDGENVRLLRRVFANSGDRLGCMCVVATAGDLSGSPWLGLGLDCNYRQYIGQLSG